MTSLENWDIPETGAYPSGRYNRSWLTQRVLNHLPAASKARRSPAAITQQVVNANALEIQETIAELAHEKANYNLATCDQTLPEHLWKIDLPGGFVFGSSETQDRLKRYSVPGVWAEIDNEWVKLSQAEENNIQTLLFSALPTRIEYAEEQVLWQEAIPTTLVSELGEISPIELPIEGPLYITLSDNDVWHEEYKNTLYFSKVQLKGTGLFDEEIEETIPLRLNATFVTRSHWKTLDEIFVLHVGETAKISVASLPFDEVEVLNIRDVSTNLDGWERYQFYELGEENGVSVFSSKRYLSRDLDQVRLGIDAKTIDSQIELLDENGVSIEANAFVFKPWTNLIYVVDDAYFYVYDYSLPYPEVKGIEETCGDNRIAITFSDDKWCYVRNEDVEIHTRILDLASVPFSTRWSITFPSGTSYRLGLDGSLWSTDIDGWIFNADYADGAWEEQKIVFSGATETGTYVLTLEAKYKEEDGTIITRSTRELFSIPAISPEVQLLLPVELRNCRDLGFDGEGALWFYNGTSLLKTNIYHDYFMADFQKRVVWFREQYSNVRVAP